VGADQVYVLPAGTVPFGPPIATTGETWKVSPSQEVAVILEIYGRGFTVITTVNGLLLEHPFVRVGATVKVTVCAMLEVLEKIPAITEEFAAKFTQVTLEEEAVAPAKV
jgi:hypothetical protein